MSFTLNAIFSLSIGLSVLIGWIRFYKTDPAFFPFLLLVSVGFANEVISIVLALYKHSNTLPIWYWVICAFAKKPDRTNRRRNIFFIRYDCSSAKDRFCEVYVFMILNSIIVNHLN